MRFFRPPPAAKLLYPEAVFRLKGKSKSLWLTFDDGPCEETTRLILDILDAETVAATFFLTGARASEQPSLVEEILKRGHDTGNHGYKHCNGWKSSSVAYLENIERCREYSNTRFFRPPYGKITPSQYKIIRISHRIVFWDLMPYDFDERMSGAHCLSILKQKIRPGSVIVLHDSKGSKAPEILGDFITYAKERGYRFEKPSD